ncbi:MAG: hypothetical protein U1E70_08695 [Acetobacteraceae bacterium]
MAATAAAAQPTFTDEKTYLIARVAGDLAPTLADKPQDRNAAMQMAWRMVKAYHPSSEAEVIAGARIASMSMLQLDLGRDATQPELTLAMKLQCSRAVVSLSRAIAEAEDGLARRQLAEERRWRAQPPVEPERTNPTSSQEAVDDATVEQMMEQIDILRATVQQYYPTDAIPPPDPDPAVPASPAADPDAPPSPVADPVEPPAPRTAPPKPPYPTGAAPFARAVAAAHAQHHAALRAAAAAPQTARPAGRQAGAGSPPPGSLAAGPG